MVDRQHQSYRVFHAKLRNLCVFLGVVGLNNKAVRFGQ